MIAVTVEKDEAGPFLAVMSNRASDWTEPLTKVLTSALADAQATITGGGADFGWAPTSSWTLKLDEVLGRGRTGPLQATGALVGSLTRGGGGNVFDVTPTEGEAGTSLPYARFQQDGTTKTFFLLQYMASGGRIREFGGRGIPPRPFLWWHEDRMSEYEAIFADHLMGEG